MEFSKWDIHKKRSWKRNERRREKSIDKNWYFFFQVKLFCFWLSVDVYSHCSHSFDDFYVHFVSLCVDGSPFVDHNSLCASTGCSKNKRNTESTLAPQQQKPISREYVRVTVKKKTHQKQHKENLYNYFLSIFFFVSNFNWNVLFLFACWNFNLAWNFYSYEHSLYSHTCASAQIECDSNEKSSQDFLVAFTLRHNSVDISCDF